MPLPGINNQEEIDFPRPVKDSLTVLPYRASGESQLAVTDVPDDLVLVSALRRFENKLRVAEGTHTGGNNQTTTLTDSTADFINWGVEVGDRVINTTDGNSQWRVDVLVSATVLTVSLTLTGGGDDDFDTNDVYQINKLLSHQSARAAEIRKIRITSDLDVYVELDGEANSASHWLRVNAGDAINEDGIRVVSRISIINVTNPERPTIRWNVWGV